MEQILSRISFDKRISDLRNQYQLKNAPSELLEVMELNVTHTNLHYVLTPINGISSKIVNAIIEKHDWPTNVNLGDANELCSVRWKAMQDEDKVSEYALVNLKQNRKHSPAVIILTIDSGGPLFKEQYYRMGFKLPDNLIKKMKISLLKELAK
jgi:hypothetical protein